MRVVIDVYRRQNDNAWVTDVYVNNYFNFSCCSPMVSWCLPHAIHLIEQWYGDAAEIELNGELPKELPEKPS